MVRAVLRDEFAAGMGHAAGGFGQEERLFGQGEIDAASRLLAGEPEVVALRIESEQRKVEAVLAAGRAVTGAGVATRGC